jgi:phage-related holin
LSSITNGDEQMDKNDILLKIYGVSGIFGFLSDIFTSMQTSYIILLVLIILDTFTGISTAIKYKRFSSTGLRRATKKLSLMHFA